VVRVLSGEVGPASDIVCLNTGATLYVADLVPDIAAGITMAKAAIASGAARSTLEQFIAATQVKS
jgi:anthranilate phosphoribosyltransferase